VSRFSEGGKRHAKGIRAYSLLLMREREDP